MRKLHVYVLSAAAAFAMLGGSAFPAYAAGTRGFSGGRVVVVGQNNQLTSANSLNQLLSQLSGGNCDFSNLPVITLPGGSNSGCQDDSNGNPGIQLPVNPGPSIPGGSGNETPDNSGDQDSGSQAPDSGTELDSYAAQVVSLVNEERAKAGLAPLTVNAKASAAALTRAKELVSSFSHTRPNGSSFSTALTEAGVSFRASGENIAYGQTSAAQVMNSWMNSSGHRANILSSRYTEIGVAHYRSASGVNYWVQLFLN